MDFKERHGSRRPGPGLLQGTGSGDPHPFLPRAVKKRTRKVFEDEQKAETLKHRQDLLCYWLAGLAAASEQPDAPGPGVSGDPHQARRRVAAGR
ncbi:unnamed protein product [Merluccius merluccius]